MKFQNGTGAHRSTISYINFRQIPRQRFRVLYIDVLFGIVCGIVMMMASFYLNIREFTG